MPKQTFFNLPEERRRRILGCAVDEFYLHGFQQASISRMVEAAGIAKGSFYQYFEDKADIYEYIITHLIADLKLQITREVFSEEALRGKPLFSSIRSLFLAQIDAFFYDPKIMKLAADFATNMNGELEQRIMKKYENISESFFLPALRHSLEAGELDPAADMETLNFMLSSMSLQVTRYMQNVGINAVTKDYFMNLLDKVEYILTNGVFQKPGKEAKDGA